MFANRAPAVPLLLGLLALLASLVGAAFTVGMVQDTQARKGASLCAEPQARDCLALVPGDLVGPDEREESAGDRYDFVLDAGGYDYDDDVHHAFFTGQRSDRVWEVRDRVDAAYYWNGELVGVADPDGGVLIRSEKFSLRGPLSAAFLEVGGLCLGAMLLVAGWRRRGACAGWFTARDADDPRPGGSDVPYAVLLAAFLLLMGVAILVSWGMPWWGVLLVLALLAGLIGWPVVRPLVRPTRSRARRSGRSGKPAARGRRARR